MQCTIIIKDMILFRKSILNILTNRINMQEKICSTNINIIQIAKDKELDI